MIITLIGFMGSGKTTLGKILSKKLQYDFIDLDEYIENKESMSINAIFDQKGEFYFRDLETKYINDIFQKDNIVISLGGGTPCFNDNINLINSNSISFYLYCPEKVLFQRLSMGKENRPLIKGLDDIQLSELITKKLAERSNYYDQAKFIVKNSDAPLQEVLAVLD